MASAIGGSDLSAEVAVDAFRRLFPLQFHELHLRKSIRPDGRPFEKARDTTVDLGYVTSANGSALAKIGSTTMLAAIKMEVMTPTVESPDEGCIAIDFHMPPICSPIVRPGRPAEASPILAKQLSDTILRSGMINFKELCLVHGKAAWMAYLDIYCLDADGSLFDAALLSAVAAFSNLQFPVVSLSDEGRVFLTDENNGGEKFERKKLTLNSLPLSLTCILRKEYILADPTAEEETIMDTHLTVVLVLHSSDQRVSLYKLGGPVLTNTEAIKVGVSLYKLGGPVLANTETIKECVSLTKKRVNELQQVIAAGALSDMNTD